MIERTDSMFLIFCRAQLDEDVRVRLETASYDEMELEGVRCRVRRIMDERARSLYGILAVFALFDIFLLMTRSSPFVLAAMASVEAFALGTAWNLQAGTIKRQYNAALMKGYPHMSGLRLR